MVILDDETTETQISNRQKDNQQDTRLDSLQSAVDSINTDISAIESSITAIQNSISDNYSAQTQTLMSTLNTQIQNLISNLEDFVNTTQINADVGNFKTLISTVSTNLVNVVTDILRVTSSATIASATITNETVESSQVQSLQATSATIAEATITLLHMTELTVTTLNAATVNSDEVIADSVESDEVTSDIVKTKNITGNGWQAPIGTPDNTELLHISVPFYNGIVQIVTEDNEFNISVINGEFVSWSQKDNYIFRIERNDNATDIYLQNIGDTVNYQLILLGSDTIVQSTSEIVDKTGVKQNVLELRGILNVQTMVLGIALQFVDFIPEMGEENTLYLSPTEGGYMWDDETQTMISFVGSNLSTEVHTNTAHIGDMSELTTTATTDLVSAINEHETEINGINDTIGDLTDLTTDSKNTVVDAINEVDSHADTNAENIGDLTELETAVKTDLVSAINEITEDYLPLAGGTITGDLTVNGSIQLGEDVIANDNLTVKGDLIVKGSALITNEQSLETDSNYVVLRKNNPSGLGLTEKSGMVIHNYTSGKNASIGVDKDGIFRVSDNSSEATTTYTNISKYGSSYYQGITQTTTQTVTDGAAVAEDVDNFSDCVYNSGSYYCYFNGSWFEVSLVSNALYFDKDTPITDTSLITTLETLTKDTLFYFRSLSVVVISDVTNQPLLTRDEAADMNSKGLLQWNSDDNKAETLPLPTLSNQTLISSVDSQTGEVSYSWGTGGNGAVAHFSSMAEYETAKLIPEGSSGYLPDGTLVVIDSEDDTLKGYIYTVVKRYINGSTILDDDFAASTIPAGKTLTTSSAGEYKKYSGSYSYLDDTLTGSSIYGIISGLTLSDYFTYGGDSRYVPKDGYTLKINGGDCDGLTIGYVMGDLSLIYVNNYGSSITSSNPVTCDSIDVYITATVSNQWYKKVTDESTDPATVEYYAVDSFSDTGTLVTESALISNLDNQTFNEYTEIVLSTRS